MLGNERDKFFMVWRDGGAVPTKRHEFEYEARAEAERLARGNPGMRFFVLSAESYCEVEPTPIKWQELAEPVPF